MGFVTVRLITGMHKAGTNFHLYNGMATTHSTAIPSRREILLLFYSTNEVQCVIIAHITHHKYEETLCFCQLGKVERDNSWNQKDNLQVQLSCCLSHLLEEVHNQVPE